MQEGITSEACSLAGHLGLGHLIVLYDDNKIQIDGSTDLAFTEDVKMRYESYGWQVLELADNALTSVAHLCYLGGLTSLNLQGNALADEQDVRMMMRVAGEVLSRRLQR